jgi:hypothetical protein
VPNAGADVYSHNLYIDNGTTGVEVRGNIIANGSSHGTQMRSGGVAVNNLFVRNSIGLSVGGGNDPEPNGVTVEVHQNVFLEGKDIDQANPRGWALWLGNISAGHVTGNVTAHNVLGGFPHALILEADCSGDTQACIGVHELTIEDNVFYNWGGNVTVQGSGAQVTKVVLHANDVQNLIHADPLIGHSSLTSVLGLASSDNTFFLQQAAASDWTIVGQSYKSLSTWMALVGDVSSVVQKVLYVDPERSLAGYNGLIGGAPSLTAFLAGARSQSATNWRTEYTAAQVNAFIRDGFKPLAP